MRACGAYLLSVLGMVATLAGCTVWGQHKPTAWSDVTGGESLERVFWQQVKAKKWAEIESHVAGNYLLVTPQGTISGVEALEHWKQLELQDYSLGDFDIQPNGNTYVVSYTFTMRGKIAGRPLSEGPVRAMTVWQHTGRDWLAIAHSATPTEPKQNP